MAPMELQAAGLGLVISLTFLWLFLLCRRGGRMPPGPPWLPLVGNLFQLSRAAHVSFAELARKHGPIMTLRLGSMTTVVISSGTTAREMYKTHDAALAGRKIYEAIKGEHGTEGSLITSQYGPHWRTLRRLSASEFFTAGRLDALAEIRSGCIDAMVRFVEEDGGSGSNPVDMGKFFFLMGFNLIANLIFSKDLLDPSSERGKEFLYHTRQAMEMAGKPNVADFLPVFRRFDPQGIRRKTQFHIHKAFEIAGDFIKERLTEEKEGEGKKKKRKDYLEVLLEYGGDGAEEPSRFSSRVINVIILEMFTAGTDTTTSTLEWAMAELLRNPPALQKLQSELRTTIRPDQKLHESDLKNLPYLNAVVKETLRLHPPLPLLIPHMALTPCTMLGYHIPQHTQILVNVWAIGRDPETWSDPLRFAPERFLGSDGGRDFRGQDFEFIPFGSGRRMCPAVPLAARVLPMALGSLVLLFDWFLPAGVTPEEIDMSEKMGISLRKAVPLMAIPVPVKRERFG